MSFTQSQEYYLEQAVGALVSISGVNVYYTYSTGAKLFPYVSISAKPTRQMVGPYSGVFEESVEVEYADSSPKVTKDLFESNYRDLFGQFYSDDATFVSKLTLVANNIKVYMARIMSEEPTTNNDKRAWRRSMTINAITTYDETASAGAYAYIFSLAKNSFYIGTI